ncbi:MAG: hypothetical protein CMJ06_03140 [Pelagibacterales bacterium]|nr:hypothetical protein [Pelagibacterales bacterium]OUU62685.1 MAG: hypothetical protein CBC22_03385 [Alphaproteobacteria bacterium TMED62]|tara:strand:- start:14963 stop:16351 length:1389 start_codon:yes stop_codon:yes gene_type:complete
MIYEDYFKKEINNLNFNFLSEELKDFIPIISGNFLQDKVLFSNFWRKVNQEKILFKERKIIDKKSIHDVNEFCCITKKIFLNTYSSYIYRKITNDLKKNIRLESLCFEANNIVPSLLPTPQDILSENKLFLKEKEGLEIQQGIFLSAILQNEEEGIHLCKSMLLPLDIAEEKIEEFETNGKVDFNGAIVESFNDYDLVTLNNPDFLNAEDNRTLLSLEAAIDIAISSKKNNICVLRGSKVSHPKYKNKNIFGAGINLTHLYEGKIPFLWYITRDMGAVSKVLRGHPNKNFSLENSLFPHKNKIWFAGLETFAIGGGCQYLLVMDHIIADKNSYMTLPARKEGIIPGAANLRLWRFVGNRMARQAIQHGLKIESNSINGKKICDELINIEDMDKVIDKRVKDFKNSGLVGASYNKRALVLGEESINQFRAYMSVYCHDQAYCHFSKDLINNLEKYWHKAKDKN